MRHSNALNRTMFLGNDIHGPLKHNPRIPDAPVERKAPPSRFLTASTPSIILHPAPERWQSWSNAADSKSAVGFAHRGFESLSLRQRLSRQRFRGERIQTFESNRRERSVNQFFHFSGSAGRWTPVPRGEGSEISKQPPRAESAEIKEVIHTARWTVIQRQTVWNLREQPARAKKQAKLQTNAPLTAFNSRHAERCPSWSKGRDWKSRRGLILPSRVRIPPSPPPAQRAGPRFRDDSLLNSKASAASDAVLLRKSYPPRDCAPKMGGWGE